MKQRLRLQSFKHRRILYKSITGASTLLVESMCAKDKNSILLRSLFTSRCCTASQLNHVLRGASASVCTFIRTSIVCGWLWFTLQTAAEPYYASTSNNVCLRQINECCAPVAPQGL